ncbi:MAG: virulence factor SrfB [Candidatus Ozemobacter sibiricus]|uniref:Virulence factor SrfB n=1 Tax=Candidatus Ozemobacter sibiricus TaxID=2268124 RepID=A0A367ZR83_9BACT|nr:MAG: virulence factor SrfB [Candidatus Ozemobacter sibiricus]
MEKVEFLANTGLSFYTPKVDVRFPESLLEMRMDWRLVKSPQGAVQLTAGTGGLPADKPAPGGPKDSPGSESGPGDVGRLTIKFADALQAALGKWLPLPYNRKMSDRSTPAKSNDWIRLWIGKPPLSTDDNLYKLVFAVDTTLHDYSADGVAGHDCIGFLPDDVGFPFELNSRSTSFLRSTTLFTWISNIFKDMPGAPGGPAGAGALAMGAFLTLIEGLRTLECCPEIRFIHPEGQPAEVHFILDLGNSRACGILAENAPGQPIGLDECRKLEIRDLTRPYEVYTEPFDTSFKFFPPLFADPDCPAPHAGTSFLWPSLVRLGHEAAQMDPAPIGHTGMSSPKRYLWDDRRRPLAWYFNLPDSDTARKIGAPFLQYLDEQGAFQGGQGEPPFDPTYPPSAMMTFVLLELLCHVHAQINSWSFRQVRGQRQVKRVLASIVITTPCGMSEPEKMIYRERAQAAIDLYHHVTRCRDPKPTLVLEFDESSCVQLTWLLGEIKYRFLGEAGRAIAMLGRPRPTPEGRREPLLRVASIDIGGGTSDLMIAEYTPTGLDHAGVRQRMLFSEGYSVAGDEIAKRLIEKMILRRVYEVARERTPTLAWEAFQHFFGPGKGERDKEFLDTKAELCRQVWIPMAHQHLEFAERDTAEPSIELGFYDFFRRRPPEYVLDFFARHLKQEFGCDLNLPEITWVLTRDRINRVIENVMGNILRIFCEVIAQFDCDVIILGGKPSSLPIIRETLVRFMPVPPERIIGLKGYPVGSWYPFSQKVGGIADPKTATVVGAAVWLFAERLNNLEGLSLTTDRSRILKQECFIGTFNPEAMRLDQLLFPTAPGREVPLTVTRPVFLGVRRIDSDLCTVNPLWEVAVDTGTHRSTGGSGSGQSREVASLAPPFTVFLKQDPACKEKLMLTRAQDAARTVLPARLATLHLRTMVADQYWIDSGSFFDA